MKCGTKLKFAKNKGIGEVNLDYTDIIEDFFLGGILPKTTINDVDYYYYHPSDSSYLLITEDYDKIGKGELTVNGNLVSKSLSERYLNGEVLGSYDLQLLKQNLECKCATIRGELPYNTRIGIPLKTLPKELELAILDLITDTKGVLDCKVKSRNIEVINGKRTLRLNLTISTNFGNIEMTV